VGRKPAQRASKALKKKKEKHCENLKSRGREKGRKGGGKNDRGKFGQGDGKK